MLKQQRELLKSIIKKKNYSFLFLILSMFLLPLSINFSTFMLIISMAFKLIQSFYYRGFRFGSIALKYSATLGFIFFIYVTFNSILQTSLLNTVLLFEKQFSHFSLLFIIPFLMGNKKENRLPFYALVGGSLVAILVVFVLTLIENEAFNKYAFLRFLDIHHTYLSIYLLTLINFLLVRILSKNKLKLEFKLLLSFLIVVLFWVMFSLDSKASMIIFLLLFIIQILPILNKKSIKFYIPFLIGIILVLIAFNSKVTVNYKRALDFRLQVWEESFNVFKNNPFFGDLKYSEKDLLNYNHYLRGKYYFLDSDLNSHNQYLSFLMKYGLFGVAIFFLFAVNIIKRINLKTQKQTIREFLGWSIIILLFFYIENLLDRHHGIVYFSFTYNYYLVAIKYEEI